MEFQDVIESIDELREVIPPPHRLVVDKATPTIDEHCAAFIARSPFVLIASRDTDGSLDISPKGDPPGFVQVLDEGTLAIPDRPGNRRADTLVNVIGTPEVGLIFLVPGNRNTLRIRGRARIVRDAQLRDSMAIDGRAPDLALVVDVDSAMFHCAKCIIRSELWERDLGAPGDDSLLAEAMVAHTSQDVSVEKMQHIIDNDERTRLY